MIKIFDVLDLPLLHQAWDLYREAFTNLNQHAVQRHLDTEEEFREICLNPRIQKYLSFGDGDELRGLSCYTRVLGVETTPLISAAYYARRFPEKAAAGQIYYCLFVCVAEAHRRSSAFADMVEAMYRAAWMHNGVISLDFCRFNMEAHHLDRAITILMKRIDPDVHVEYADYQQYMIYVPGGVA